MTIYSQLCSRDGRAEKERRPRGVARLEGLDPEAPSGGRSRTDPAAPCVFLRGSAAGRGWVGGNSGSRPFVLPAWTRRLPRMAQREEPESYSYASRGESAWIRTANNPTIRRCPLAVARICPTFFSFKRFFKSRVQGLRGVEAGGIRIGESKVDADS